MQQIVNFIIRNKTFLLFLFLLSVSLTFTIQSHSYHKSRFINSANFLTGGIYNSANNVSLYFNLKSQNNLLQEENNHLRSLLFNKNEDLTSIDSLSNLSNQYVVYSANVIKNSYALPKNYLLINKGSKDSIHEDFGVITSNGILGIVDNVSSNYARVISILNTTEISASLKKSNHFGSLKWNGISPQFVQLTSIPKVAPVQKGDTIVTSGLSTIFPKDIPIGTIKNFKLDVAENFYEIDVKLFNDMTNIEHVYVVKHKAKKEIDSLSNNIIINE